MADKKISQLTGATTPLAGTEVLPIVQGGSTVKVAVSDLTAGRTASFAGTTVTSGGTTRMFRPDNAIYTDISYQTAANGGLVLNDANGSGFSFQFAGANVVKINASENLAISKAGKGIDFSANAAAAGMTSELLNWYEEGTWTPVISDGTNDATMGGDNGGYYTRIGNCVTFTAQVTVGTIDSVGANAIIKGLPFSTNTSTRSRAGVAIGFGASLNITQGRVVTGYVELNSSKIELQYWDAATGTTGLDGSEISDGGTLFISGHYYAA